MGQRTAHGVRLCVQAVGGIMALNKASYGVKADGVAVLPDC